MKLSVWLKSTKTKRYVFAGKIGVTPSVITDYCEGRMWPGSERMEAIVRETGGAVTANDFLSPEARATISDAPAAEPAQ